MELVVALVLGLAAGGVAGYLIGRGRPAPPDPRLEAELRQQLGAREAELEAARAAAAQASVALATTQARAEGTERLAAEQRRVHEEAERELREHHARIVADLRASHEAAVAELRDAFKALSADALRDAAPEFLRLATENLARFHEAARGELDVREARIETLVKPLGEQLEAYQRRLQQAETGQAATLGEVRQQLEALAGQSQALSSETQRLRLVLSSSQARGRWGEETLRRVVEAAGLSVHCEFTLQERRGEGTPDLVVRLPGDRVIIVDAKVPDLDVLAAVGAADEVRRSEALAAHAAKLRETIKALADRDYPTHFPNALDHVVLFLPAESLFSAALEGDRELIVWAAERRIMLATPASLIALLRSVAMSWKQHEQTANAREIAAAAGELYRRVVTFVGHFEDLREALGRAAQAYDKAVGSYERMVRPSGERLLALGAQDGGKGELPEVRALAAPLRPPPPAAP